MASESVLVGVVDYGIGTWTSVVNMLDSIGVDGESCGDPEQIDRFSHLILPGVGNFSVASSRLDTLGWRSALTARAEFGIPFLGICLGMQLLGTGSSEGEGEGLSLLNFKSEPLSSDGDLRVPHIGWNTVRETSEHQIFNGWTEEFRFYFVHSFAVSASCPESIGITEHNMPFSSVVAKGNIVGVQFHPEKSHKYGQRLLSNFATMNSGS